MNRTQKTAWFTLVMLALAAGLSLTAFCVLYFIFDWPAKKATAGFAFISIMGFSGLAHVLFKKENDKVKMDERDLIIKQKAMFKAYWMFWPMFVLAAFVPFLLLGPEGTVGVLYLAWLVFGGIFFILLIQSIVYLEEYGWRDKGENHE